MEAITAELAATIVHKACGSKHCYDRGDAIRKVGILDAENPTAPDKPRRYWYRCPFEHRHAPGFGPYHVGHILSEHGLERLAAVKRWIIDHPDVPLDVEDHPTRKAAACRNDARAGQPTPANQP